MNDPITLELLQNEVLRKIGGNVLNFQKMEAMLKMSIVHSHIQCNPLDPVPSLEKSKSAVSMKTMGNLVGDYVKAIHKPGNHTHNPPDENTFWISFSSKFGFDESFIEEHQASLARLVEERNKLIHQLLPLYDQSSIDGCMAMIKTLDEQHNLLAPEYKRVTTIYRQIKEPQKEAINLLFDEMERKSE